MRRTIFPVLLVAASFAAACDSVEENPASVAAPCLIEKSFHADLPGTKVLLDSGHNAIWEASDGISVEGNSFTRTGTEGSAAVFSGTVTVERDSYLAVLPYSEGLSFTGNERVSGTFPQVQSAKENGCPYPLAYALSEGMSMHFRHLTSVLQFTLADDMTGVQSITLRGNASEPLAGNYFLEIDGGTAVFALQGTPLHSLTLNGTIEAGKTYCFSVPGLGTEFSAGLSLDFTFEDGTAGSISNSSPITLRRGEWTNLSNGLHKSALVPSDKGIASLHDWRAFKSALESSSSLEEWTWAGEVVLAADIEGLTDADVLHGLDVPLNGKGHTITFNGTSSLIDTLYADVSNLNLAGSIDFRVNSNVGALAAVARTGVTVSRVNSSVDISAGALGATHNLRIGGLVGIAMGDSGTLAFRKCKVSGGLVSLNYANSVGGIIAHGGGGKAPEVLIDGCMFDGSISYTQGACPFDFNDGKNYDRPAGRVGGLIGDVSRVVRIRNSSTGTSCTMDLHLSGMTLGDGGAGGLAGRNTANSTGYTMSLAFEGNCANNAAITVYDALESQHNLFGKVLGSKKKAYEGSGIEGGSLNFVSSPAGAGTTGHFSMVQIAGQNKISMKRLNGTNVNTVRQYMSYLLVTTGGKVIVIDGGWGGDDAAVLGDFILSFGGRVDAWFISHPHEDHFGALDEILSNTRGITIGTIYHSRVSPSMYAAGSVQALFYSKLDSFAGNVVDVRVPGGRYDVDGVGIKVLSVTDESLSGDPNNSSMVLRVWDGTKSVVFLGDCGVLEGRKLLATFRDDLDCDYLQLGHHGNKGCEESFYRTVSFSHALVPTAEWIWHPEYYYSSMPDHLDGGATRSWIESILPASDIITSYDHGHWWLNASDGSRPAVLDGFNIGDDNYFN